MNQSLIITSKLWIIMNLFRGLQQVNNMPKFIVNSNSHNNKEFFYPTLIWTVCKAKPYLLIKHKLIKLLMRPNHNLTNRHSPKQNNKHKKLSKWLRKQESRLKLTEEAEINSKMSNWEKSNSIRLCQKHKEKNNNKDWCLEKLQEMLNKAQDSLSIYSNKVLEPKSSLSKFLLHNKSLSIFTLMSRKITLMWERKISSKSNQWRFTFMRITKR